MRSEEKTRQTFNRLKAYYDASWDPRRQTLHVGMFRRNTRTLQQAYRYATDHLVRQMHAVVPFEVSSAILDVGCGAGQTLIELCERYGCTGIGVDVSDAQIRAARTLLRQKNKERKRQRKPCLQCRFLRGSASALGKILGDTTFTHIISQDALFLVARKKECFRQLFRHLAPGGVLSIADFLEERRGIRSRALTHRVVNWRRGLSFAQYQSALCDVGFRMLKAEQHANDMLRTYRALAQRLQSQKYQRDPVYQTLLQRYTSIAQSVQNGTMGWGVFVAQKDRPQTILLTGTKPHSLGGGLPERGSSSSW